MSSRFTLRRGGPEFETGSDQTVGGGFAAFCSARYRRRPSSRMKARDTLRVAASFLASMSRWSGMFTVVRMMLLCDIKASPSSSGSSGARGSGPEEVVTARVGRRHRARLLAAVVSEWIHHVDRRLGEITHITSRDGQTVDQGGRRDQAIFDRHRAPPGAKLREQLCPPQSGG